MRFFIGQYNRRSFILVVTSITCEMQIKTEELKKNRYTRIKNVEMLYGLRILQRQYALACAVPASPHKLMLSRGIILG